MKIIPCEKNIKFNAEVRQLAEAMKTDSHKLGSHGYGENDFYNSGLFRGAIERVRGQFAAAMSEKRKFVDVILSHLQDKGFIKSYESSGAKNRHDYSVVMQSGKIAVIELKGCLDGNNTNIFQRPSHASEFIIWSVCTNKGADPQRNAWSGIHTRLSATIIAEQKRVDGVVIWDWVCGTIARPCPKLSGKDSRCTVAQFHLPPPCIYLFPSSIPTPRNNPNPKSQPIDSVEILKAFHQCFGGSDDQLNGVDFEVAHRESDTIRRTKIHRNGVTLAQSDETAIRRE